MVRLQAGERGEGRQGGQGPRALIAAPLTPDARPTLFFALDEFLDLPPLVVLRGDARSAGWAPQAARANPRARIVRLGSAAAGPALDRYAGQGPAFAYVCRGTACSAPITARDDLLDALRDKSE